MRRYVTWMLITSMLGSPAASFGADFQSIAQGASEKVELKNVQLAADGTLQGQVVDTAGLPQQGVTVAVQSQSDMKSTVARISSDTNGRFAIAGLKDGVCVLNIGGDSFAVRVWSHNIAPPKSLATVALVHGKSVTRGQGPLSNLRNSIANLSTTQKVGLGLLTAAAITIPIALDDDDDDAS